MPDAIETFWPPPKRLIRRWRRSVTILFGAPTLLMMVAFRAAQAYLIADVFGFDPARYAAALLPTRADVPFIALLLAVDVAFPYLLAWIIGRHAVRGPSVLSCDEAERPLAVCMVQFLDGRTYYPGFLAITDRRLVLLGHTPGKVREATIATRDQVASIERTVRHATRKRLLRIFLRLFQREHGLAITTRDGRRVFLVTEAFFLEPLVAWLEKNGFAVGFANDADLEKPAPVSALAFTERPRPAASKPSHARTILAVLLLGACALVAANVQTVSKAIMRYVVRAAAIETIKVNGPLPSLASTGSAPAGSEWVLAKLYVDNYQWSGPPQERGIQRYELVRVGDAAFLRGETGWESIGAPGDTIDQLIAKARERLTR